MIKGRRREGGRNDRVRNVRWGGGVPLGRDQVESQAGQSSSGCCGGGL
jgi:hypothetical protein